MTQREQQPAMAGSADTRTQDEEEPLNKKSESPHMRNFEIRIDI